MKLLIAFAIIAVAIADEIKPVRLPEARASDVLQNIDIRPLIIPEAVINAIKENVNSAYRVNVVSPSIVLDVDGLKVRVAEPKINFVRPVEIARAPLPEVVEPFSANEDAVRVQFVDAPIEENDANVVISESSFSDDEGLKVHFVDSPQADVLRVVEPFSANEDAVRVQFVDAPIEENDADVVISESSFSDDEGLKVHFVDSPQADVLRVVEPVIQEAPILEAVKIVEPVLKMAPSVEAVRIAAPVFKQEPVEAIRVANPFGPGKYFADPRLR